MSRVAEYGYDQRVEVLGELGMATAHNVLENTVVASTLVGHVAPRAQWSFPQRYEHDYPANLARFNLLVRTTEHAAGHLAATVSKLPVAKL